MNMELSKFFYNIVPGNLFLILWLYLFDTVLGGLAVHIAKLTTFVGNEGLIAVDLLFSLFIGYLLQGLWQLVKPKLAFANVLVEKEEYDNFNAYLWANNKQALSQYYSFYVSIWSNTMVGSVFSIILIFGICLGGRSLINFWAILVVLIALLCLSTFLYKKYLIKMHRSVIRQGKVLGLKLDRSMITEEQFRQAKKICIKISRGS